MSYIDFKNLVFNEKSTKKIWNILLYYKDENLYNLIISLKVFSHRIDLNFPYTAKESEVYCNNKKKTFHTIIISMQKLLENKVNEIIKTDLKIITDESNKITVVIPLDSFYSIQLNHLKKKNFNEESELKENSFDEEYKLKKKKSTKDLELEKKILNVNIIINTLERIGGISFYTSLKKKNKENYEGYVDGIKKINYTKGYLVCIEPNLVEELKHYKYTRKMIRRSPILIEKIKKDNLNLIESLNNDSFTHPIWLENDNINQLKLTEDETKENVFNSSLLNEDSNIEKCLENINFLNSIELSYNKETFEKIYEVLEKKLKNKNTMVLTKNNKIIDNVYKINTPNYNQEVTDKSIESNNFLSLIGSESVKELIRNQLSYYDTFYLDYRMDSRTRTYCYPWPISYQLNHIVRVVIKIKKERNHDDIWLNFINNKEVKPYLQNYNCLEHTQLKENEIFKETMKLFNVESFSEIEKDLKKEYVFIQLFKFVPNDIKNLDDKLLFINKNIKKFMESDLSITFDYWKKVLKIKNKKLPYIMGLHQSLKDASQNVFNHTFWGDASSNAIQLITLRLEIFDKKLMMLTNIINNDTDYENIYEYLTDKLKKRNHSAIVLQLKNKITEEEVSYIQEKDLNKYLIMPSSYGMGKNSYKEKIDGLLDEEKTTIWEKLEENEKQQLSKYYWHAVNEELQELSFNTEFYKNICNKFSTENKKDVYIWKTDLGVSIAPIRIIKNNRQKLLKQQNELNWKIKKEVDQNKKEILKNNLKIIKNKLTENDKTYWKRTKVQMKKTAVCVRIFHHTKIMVNKHDTRRALIPNTIHAYDASILHLTIKICKDMGIEILVIHDSIGCQPLYAPIVKTVFKVANIILLDKSLKEKQFPIVKEYLTDKEYDKKNIFKEILESKNFFR